MNNKQITDNIITNNTIGSFFVVMWREQKPGKIDFIDPIRISIYHHVILKEHHKYTFPDIMEMSTSCDQSEYSFNNLDDIYGEDCDYWLDGKEIKRAGKTPEEAYNTYVEILENKSMAIINSKIMIYKKLCAYKITVMEGKCIPIYGMKIVHTRFKKFDLLSGDDILKNNKLTRTYLRHIKEIL